MRPPRLRTRLAVGHALAMAGVVSLATILLAARTDDLRRFEAESGAQHDAEVLALQVRPVLSEPARLGPMVTRGRDGHAEVLALDGSRLAGSDLTSNALVARSVVEQVGDGGISAVTASRAQRSPVAIGVEPVMIGDEQRAVVAVAEPVPERRSWRQLYGLDLPAVLALSAVAALAPWWLAGRISRPLDKLTAQASALVLSGRALPAPESPIPEIATLTAAMTRLSDRVGDDTDRRNRVESELQRLSHELRTPLTTIRLRLDAFEHASPTEAAVVVGQLDRIGRLSDELAHLRWRPRHTEAVDLGVVAATAGAGLRPLASWGRIDLRTDVVRSFVVPGEPRALADAVVNVLENAIKYTPAGGQVGLTVDHDDGEGWVEVADTGPGIAVSLGGALTHPGVRATVGSSIPGSGQGLAIVAATLDRHGGRVELGASPSGGALVRLVMPLPGTDVPTAERVEVRT